MKNYRIRVVKPLRAGKRVHTVIYYSVLAKDEADATNKLKVCLNELGYGEEKIEHIGQPDERDDIQTVLFTSCTPAELRQMKGLPEPKTKPAPERKLSTRKLGDTQLSVLKSLHEHGGWPGGWVWNTDAGTARIIESLYQRCLVERADPKRPGDYGRYTINAEGLKAIGK